MKTFKKTIFFLLPLLFLIGFMTELSAKCHHRHYKKSRTSFSFNVNMDARPYYPGYAVVPAPVYYEPVAVVRPYAAPVYSVAAPVYPVAVQRPAAGFYLNPSFTYWRY